MDSSDHRWDIMTVEEMARRLDAAGVDRAFWFVWGDGHQHVEEWSQFVASGPQGWQFGDWSRATVTLRLDGVTEDEACRTMLRSFNVAAD